MGFISKIGNLFSGIAGSDRALKKEYQELDAPRKEFVRAVNEFEKLYGKFTNKYYGKLQSIHPKHYRDVVELVDKIKAAQALVLRRYQEFVAHMFHSVQVLDYDTFTVRASYEAEHRKMSDDQVITDMANMVRQAANDYESGVITTRKELQKTLGLIKKLDRKTA